MGLFSGLKSIQESENSDHIYTDSNLYFMAGNILHVIDTGNGHAIILYDIDTSQGQNGAPI